MSLIRILALVVLCGVAYAGHYNDANNYMDSVLSFLRQELPYSYLDPYPLHNVIHEFKEAGVDAIAIYYGGDMTGFSRVRRQGNCVGTKRIRNYVSLNCTLVLDNVGVEYVGTLKYSYSPHQNIQARGNFTKITAFIQVIQFEPSYQYQPQVLRFNVSQMGSLTMSVTGLGPLSRFYNTLVSRLVTVVTPQFHTIFNRRFREALNNSVARMPLPPV